MDFNIFIINIVSNKHYVFYTLVLVFKKKKNCQTYFLKIPSWKRQIFDLSKENKTVQTTMIYLKENWTLGVVIDMALTEIQGLGALYLYVKLGVSHTTRVRIGKCQVTKICFVFFGQFDIARVDHLWNRQNFNKTIIKN